MRCCFNTMVKNESVLLKNLLPIWSKYPIEFFVFYDDNSSDDTIDVIKHFLEKDRFIVLNDNLSKFNEGYQRQRMIDQSKLLKFDYVFCIDADELLSTTIVNDFENFMDNYKHFDLFLFWYNCVNGNISFYRTDNSYINNFRRFILPLKKTHSLNIHNWKFHTPRTPDVDLPKKNIKDYGVLHLQSCNKKYYALKQLWYKHYELKNYKHSINEINQKYDPVVNNLNFYPKSIENKIIDGIEIDLSFFDDLAEIKGYVSFIKENFNEQLVTFGKEFL